MIRVNRNIMINKAGGTSGSGTKNYRVSIPVDHDKGTWDHRRRQRRFDDLRRW